MSHLLTKKSRFQEKETKNFEFKVSGMKPPNGTLTPPNFHIFSFFDFLYQLGSCHLCFFPWEAFRPCQVIWRRRICSYIFEITFTCSKNASPTAMDLLGHLFSYLAVIAITKIENLCSLCVVYHFLSYVIWKFLSLSQFCDLARESHEPADYSNVSLEISSYLWLSACTLQILNWSKKKHYPVFMCVLFLWFSFGFRTMFQKVLECKCLDLFGYLPLTALIERSLRSSFKMVFQTYFNDTI